MMDDCIFAMLDQDGVEASKRMPRLRGATMPAWSVIGNPIGLHRAPVPEDEPLPGEEPEPDDDPVPHPDPVIREPDEAPPIQLRHAPTLSIKR